MADRRYLGHAAGVKHVLTITVANTWATNDTVTLTIDNIDVVITIGTLVTTAQVATTIKQVFNGETLTDTAASYTPNSGVQTIGQFTELVATVSSSVVTLTASVAGKPVTMSVTESTAGTGTATLATGTTATGKYHFSQADNWSGNTVPTDGDRIIFDLGSIGPQHGLAPAIQPLTLELWQSFTGLIGLPEQNIDNPSYPFAEYRTKSLTFDDNGGATGTYRLGLGEGQGSSRVRLDCGAGKALWHVYGSGAREVTGVPAILLAGTNAANELKNYNGDVGVAFYGSESGTLAKLQNGNGPTSSAKTYCGTNVTLSSCTVEMLAGQLTTNTAVSAVNMTGGDYIHQFGTITTLKIWGGRTRYRTGGTLTTLHVGKSGIFDKSENADELTITNAVQLFKGARIYDPNGSINFNAGFVLNGCNWTDVEVILSNGRTYDPNP
jgi:hypothetical protein